nr:hypothetical protein [Tanacetum cinerariifolium]
MGEGLANPTNPHHIPTIIPPSTSQPKKTKPHRKPKRKDTELPQTSVPTSVADEAINEEMDASLERRSRTYRLKRLYKVGFSERVESSEDKDLGEEDASKQGRIADIDANEDITLVSTHDEKMFEADQYLGGEEVFVV